MALQMTWQPSLLHQKRKQGPPLGLKNLGNTCYLNSVLQCLTYTPPLANFCLKLQHSSSCDSGAEKKSDCPFCILEKRIVRSLSIDSTLDTPAKINSCLKIFAEHFKFGRQEDAHEFLRYVIDACHNTCLRLKKLQQQRRKGGNGGCGGGGGESSTVVKEIFGGALQSQVKCLSCGGESNKVDEIMDISLDVLHSGSLKESLQKFFQSEVLDGHNKYRCDNCKKLVAARKQMSILQAPNVLVIQLKRFEGIYGGKIDKAIPFDEVLVLSSYMCKASRDLYPEYNLFGTIVHSGFSPDSGHYYAYIKDAIGRWYCCNDSYVSISTLQEVLSEKVYILFFSRTKQRPVTAKTALTSNGVKTRDCNGNDMSKSSVAGRLVKPVNTKQLVNHSSDKNNSTTTKVDKVYYGPQMKPSNPEQSVAEKLPANGKVYYGPQMKPSNPEQSVAKTLPANGSVKFVIHKTEFYKNGNAKPSLCTEKKEDETNNPSVVVRNGLSGSRVDGESSLSFPIANGNGHVKSFNVNSTEANQSLDNGSIHQAETRKVSNHQALANGSVHGSSEISGSKRKLPEKESCILLAKDAHSLAKLEEFKKDLRKEASIILRSCGWSDKVHSYMNSRKKFCAREVNDPPSNNNETKRLLIADAKQNFISQIPESLKENLIERLRVLSREK